MRDLRAIVGGLATLVLALPLGAAGADEARKVTIGAQVGLVAVSAGSVWAPDQTLGKVVRLDAATGKIQARLKGGLRPFSALPAFGSVWVTDLNSGVVLRIDPKTNRIRRITVGSGPYGLAAGGGSVWVSNSSEGTVARISPQKNRVVKRFRAGAEPNGLLYAHGALWVGDYGASRLLRIAPATGKVTNRWTIAKADWITSGGGSLWVSSEPGKIVRIDPAKRKIVARIAVGRNPLATAWVGGELWVPSIDANTVSVVSPATNSVRATRTAGLGPASAAATARAVWVGDSADGDVWRLPRS